MNQNLSLKSLKFCSLTQLHYKNYPTLIKLQLNTIVNVVNKFYGYACNNPLTTVNIIN